MAVPSVSFKNPTIIGDRVTDRERQLEDFLTIFLKDLEYHLNLQAQAINEGSSPGPGPDPPVPPTPTPTPETDTVSGRIVAITDAASGLARKVTANIDTLQEGSGTPSPTNVREFIGVTSATLEWWYDSEEPTATEVDFPLNAGVGGFVYGGNIDYTTGTLTVTRGYILNYAGEVLPGYWMSSTSVYSQGGRPNFGDQVVYDLETPQTFTVMPVPVMLQEDVANSVMSSTGDVTVTYVVKESEE